MRRLIRHFRIPGFALTCLAASATSGLAQSDAPNTQLDIERGDSARAYAEGLRFSRIQKDIFYIDELNQPIPMNGLPRFERRPEPEVEEAPEVRPITGGERWGTVAIFAVLILIIGYIAYRFGSGFGGSFQKRPDKGGTGTRQNGTTRPVYKPETPTEILLAQLRAMEDRREALVTLIEHLLPAAAHQNDIRLGRSETAREIIRRLPGKWTMLPELKRIVMTEELVQFGGRDLPERTFEDCLRRAIPILDGASKGRLAA